MVGMVSESNFDPNGLVVNGPPIFGEAVTIVSGQTLLAGDLLGQITSGGKYKKSLTASNDGSEVPSAILAEDCDASGGDKTAWVYYCGGFAEDKIRYGSAHTAATTRKALAQKGIFIFPRKAA